MKQLLLFCALCLLSPLTRAAPGASEQQQKYLKAFDTVWSTVNQQFYDPALLGVNWKAVGKTYRARVPAVQDDASFVDLIRQMPHQLPSSHLGFRGPDASYDTSIGALLRTIDGKDVVVDVWFGTDAAQKGLKPGDVILSDKKNLDGAWGSFASVRVSTCDGQQKQLNIRREDYGAPFERPSVRWQLFEPSPTQKIGYMHIQHFEDDVAPVVDQAMSEMVDTSALVIDVRNNSGGNASYIRLVSYGHGLSPVPRQDHLAGESGNRKRRRGLRCHYETGAQRDFDWPANGGCSCWRRIISNPGRLDLGSAYAFRLAGKWKYVPRRDDNPEYCCASHKGRSL